MSSISIHVDTDFCVAEGNMEQFINSFLLIFNLNLFDLL